MLCACRIACARDEGERRSRSSPRVAGNGATGGEEEDGDELTERKQAGEVVLVRGEVAEATGGGWDRAPPDLDPDEGVEEWGVGRRGVG